MSGPMKPDKTLLLIGHPTEAVVKAKALGLDVILFQHKSKFEPAQAELADATFLVDYTDMSVTLPLAESARQIWGFSAALSLTDPGLEAAGRINDRYRLGGTGFLISNRLRDKWAMRRFLATAGAATIGAELVTDRESLTSFGATYGYPFIVKPVDLAGSFGVLRVDDAAGAGRAWEQIVHMRATGVDRGPAALFTVAEFLMEEFVGGPELSVEAFSFAGRHVVLAVTEYETDDAHFAKLGHTVPARIDAAMEDQIVATVTEFLSVVGLTDGLSHTEVRIGEFGPVIIESHNRGAGDHIMDLVHAAYGVDLVSYAVGWPFGLVEELKVRPRPIGGGCVRVLRGRAPGRIVAIDGIAELNARPDVIAAEVYVRPGDLLRPIQDDFDRLGLVAVAGPDSEAALALCKELIASSVHIQIDDQTTADAA